MPLQWAIDHGTRTVVATGSGVLCLGDIQEYFYDLAPATLSYGKLLNLDKCSLCVTGAEVTALAEQVNGFRLRSRVGPAAVLVASAETHRQVSDFKAMTESTRPLEVFFTRDAAYTWLAAHRPEPTSPFDELDRPAP
jgi:hypothetical protein